MSLVITSAIITTAGENLFAQVIASSGAMTITSIQFGSGFPAPGDNVPGYTSLKTFVMNGQITGSNNLVQSQATIRVNISSALAPTTFQVNEIGVFAQLGVQPPVMFAYATTGAATGDTVTPTAPSSAIVKDYALLILFSQNVPSATTVTLQQVVGLHASTHLDNGMDPIPPPSTTRSGLLLANPNTPTKVLTGNNPPAWNFLPIVTSTNPGGAPNTPNDGTQVFVGAATGSWAPVPQVTNAKPGGLPVTPLAANYSPFTNAAGVVTWQAGIPIISVNTTLYVTTTGNDSTAQPNNASLPWLTIQGALNYLIPYFIEPGVTVTVSVGAGIFSISSQILVNHPNGQNIQIVGSFGPNIATTSCSMSGSVTTITGSSGAFGSISAGDYISVTGANSAAETTQAGIVNVSTCNGTSLTYTLGGSTLSISGSSFIVNRYNTLIEPSAGVNAIAISGNGLGLIYGIAFIGAGSGSINISALTVIAGVANATQCGAYGWLSSSDGGSGFISVSSGSLNLTHCNANINSRGFVCNTYGASMTATACLSVRNARGFYAESSSMFISLCYASGNSDSGIRCNDNSTVTFYGGGSGIFYNITGIVCSNGSVIVLASSTGCVSSNNSADVSISIISIVARQAGPTFVYSTTNVTPNTLSFDGCWFAP